jgi:7-cyano-7-deazaguanine reductase
MVAARQNRNMSYINIFVIMRTDDELKGVTLLGCQGVKYSSDYNPDILETFDNKHADNEYVVTFDCPEFTTLCPKTGQPDFGHIFISYIPRQKMVESKSLKLYLFSFRIHEDCVNIIMKDLKRLMDPRYIEVKGIFMPRGGISIYPFANWGDDEHKELCLRRREQNFPQIGK